MRINKPVDFSASRLPAWPWIVLACLLVAGCESEPPPPDKPKLVRVMRVADVEALTERAFPGRALAGKEVNLAFRVSGPLVQLPVAVGDQVTAGQVVAQMDPQDYRNTLDTARGHLQQAEARAIKGVADFRRVQAVFEEDPGATSETAIDLARAERDASRAAVAAAASTVRIAEDQVDYTSLKAPFSGEVVETYVENFENVVAKQPILRLLDSSSIEFVINVPEHLINYTPYVESVVVTFDALPGVEIPASVKEIGREASRATRTYPVTLGMSQVEGTQILPGMAGSASVNARLPEDAGEVGIEIPASALFKQTGSEASWVWIVDEQSRTLSRREVEVGKPSRAGVLIRGGVAPGEWLVTAGVHSVREGQKVRMMDEANAP